MKKIKSIAIIILMIGILLFLGKYIISTAWDPGDIIDFSHQGTDDFLSRDLEAEVNLWNGVRITENPTERQSCPRVMCIHFSSNNGLDGAFWFAGAIDFNDPRNVETSFNPFLMQSINTDFARTMSDGQNPGAYISYLCYLSELDEHGDPNAEDNWDKVKTKFNWIMLSDNGEYYNGILRNMGINATVGNLDGNGGVGDAGAFTYEAYMNECQSYNNYGIQKPEWYENVEITEENGYIGPFYVEYPSVDINYEFNDVKTSWGYEDYSGNTKDEVIDAKVYREVEDISIDGDQYYSDRQGTAIGTEIPNKQEFYIKVNSVGTNAKIRFYHQYNTYFGRMYFFTGNGGGQSTTVMRGGKRQHVTSVEYEIKKPQIEVQKYILKVDDTTITGNGLSTSRAGLSMEQKLHTAAEVSGGVGPVQIQKPTSISNEVKIQYELVLNNNSSKDMVLTEVNDLYNIAELGEIQINSSYKYKLNADGTLTEETNMPINPTMIDDGYNFARNVTLGANQVWYIKITLTVSTDTSPGIQENKLAIRYEDQYKEDVDYINIIEGDKIGVKKYIIETESNGKTETISERENYTLEEKRNNPVGVTRFLVGNTSNAGTVTYKMEVTNLTNEPVTLTSITDNFSTYLGGVSSRVAVYRSDGRSSFRLNRSGNTYYANTQVTLNAGETITFEIEFNVNSGDYEGLIDNTLTVKTGDKEYSDSDYLEVVETEVNLEVNKYITNVEYNCPQHGSYSDPYYNNRSGYTTMDKLVYPVQINCNKNCVANSRYYSSYKVRVTYQVDITNNSDINFNNVSIRDTFGGSYSDLRFDGTYSRRSTTTHTVNEVAARSTTSVTVTVEVNLSSLKSGITENKVTIESAYINSKRYTINKSAYEYYKVQNGDPEVGITKEITNIQRANNASVPIKYKDGKPVVEVGDIITYTFKVQNYQSNHTVSFTHSWHDGSETIYDYPCENKICYIKFEDYYDPSVLQLLSNQGVTSSGGKITVTRGSTSGKSEINDTFTIKMQVIKEPPVNEDYIIANRANVVACTKICVEYDVAKHSRDEEGNRFCNGYKTQYKRHNCTELGDVVVCEAIMTPYDVGIDVFIQNVYNASLSNVKSYGEDRANKTIQFKAENPVNIVEKGYYVDVVYRIKNNSQYNPVKNVAFNLEEAVSIQGNRISGADTGIEVVGVQKDIINANANNRQTLSEGLGSGRNVSDYIVEDSDHQYRFTNTISPNKYVDVVVRYKINKTNMFLYLFEWQGNITRFENLNGNGSESGYNYYNAVLKGQNGILNNLMQYDSNPSNNINKDYAQLKDLIVAGSVWLDKNVDGIKQEDGLDGIRVYLVNADTNTIAADSVTSGGGKYEFKDVPKANNKDDKGRYTSNSRYIKYYVEFEYNGHKYSSTKYSGTTGTTREGMNNNYENLSHAAEFKTMRKTFNDKLGIISDSSSNTQNASTFAYNTRNSTGTLTYENYNNHVSNLGDIDKNNNLKMTARSFINTDIELDNNYKDLFLYVDNNDYYFYRSDADTEYLKYINLGLKERAKLDLKLEQVLQSIQTDINGKTAVYNYGEYSDRYITDYDFAVYNSDYTYRTEKYSSEIQNIKGGKDKNDLNVTLTYKVTITNESKLNTFNMDEDGRIVAKINEIANYFSNTSFVDGYVDDGYHSRVIPEGNKYAKNKSDKGDLKCQILTLDTPVSLLNGQHVDIYLTYTVNKNSSDAIHLGEIYNYSEIATYSSFYNSVDAYGFAKHLNTPGLADIDSVPNNIADKYKDADKFEDDIRADKLDIELLEKPTPSPDPDPELSDSNYRRTIRGNVWEDLRTKGLENGQLVANGQKDAENGIGNITVLLMEVVKDATGTEYLVDTGIYAVTDSNGNYTLSNFVPGDYIVRFFYGMETASVANVNDTNITVESDGYAKIPHSGQDYKSTTYTDIENRQVGIPDNQTKEGKVSTIDASLYNVYGTTGRNQKSYAADNELRRLEVINYSTTIKNSDDEILKGVGSPADMMELVNNTYMFADTRNFAIEVEYTRNRDNNNTLFNNGNLTLENQYVLDKLTTNNNTFKANSERYQIKNVNFGIEERPMTKLQMLNDIKRITLTTSDNKVLVDLHYDITYKPKDEFKLSEVREKFGIESTATLNESESIGEENVQALPNKDGIQGFRSINVDEDLLQGLTVEVEYQIAVVNDSEVDTTDENLINLVKDNQLENAIQKIDKQGNYIKRYQYNGGSSGLKDELCYSYSVNNLKDIIDNYNAAFNDGKYRNHSGISGYVYGNGYFLGRTYYSGKVDSSKKEGSSDEYTNIVETRLDQVISIVDNELVFDTSKNSETVVGTTENTQEAPKWQVLSRDELQSEGILGLGTVNNYNLTDNIYDDSIFEHLEIENGFEIVEKKEAIENDIGEMLYEDKNNQQIQYITESEETDGTKAITKHNLPVSTESNTINPTLYKFKSSWNDTLHGDKNPDNVGGAANSEDFYPDIYNINLKVSRVVGTQDDDLELAFDNIAEIVKFTNTVGRRSIIINDDNIGEIGTMGNSIFSVNGLLHDNLTVLKEIDTDRTERITLTPPTGLELAMYYRYEIIRAVLIVLITCVIAISGYKISKIKKKYK